MNSENISAAWWNWTVPDASGDDVDVNDSDIFTNISGRNETSADVHIDWDDWDGGLWTPEQREILEGGVIPRHVHISLGILLAFIVLFGVIANSAILYVFSRFKRLRTPANVFIINLTICDFFACCLHPLAVYSAFRGRWSFGQTGCNLYGMGVAFFGLNSIITLSAIACERYIVITSSSCRPVVAKWRITRRQAQKACAGIWLHCAALVSPPLLFGWSTYLPEGVLVTCSWDYTSRTLSNRLYYFYLLFFGFVLPVSVLTFCYVAIFRFIVRSSKEMTRLIMTSDGRASFSKTTVSFRKRRRQTDVRTALIILSLAMLCYTAWTPYAIVSLIGQFGPVDENGEPKKLSPMATAIPAFLAKTAIVFDPLVYGFSHPQFRSSVRQILRQHSLDSSANGIRGGPNNTTMIVMRRPTTRNCHSPRASSNVVFTSLSRSIRVNAKENASRKLSNDPSVSTSIVTQNSQFRFPPHPDMAANIQQIRKSESLRKSCMNKRNNSLNYAKSGSTRRKGSGSSKHSHQSLSAAEEVSIANSSSLRLMMLQEESEFHLFRQQQTTAGKLQRAAKRERMIQLLSSGNPPADGQHQTNASDKQGENKRRRSSEPDLMRCSVRLIADAPSLSWEEYRRKRNQYIRSIFFRSAGNLLAADVGVDKNGFSEYPILLLTAGSDDVKEAHSPKDRPACKSPQSATGRKLSMTVQSVDRFRTINNRMGQKLQHLDADGHQKNKAPSNCVTTSRRRASSSSLSVERSKKSGSNLSTPTYQTARRYSASPVHDQCCECAYKALSQTVTLVKMATSSSAADSSSNERGQAHWRACMVSGRDSLSCSLNSP
ncbi:arthropsin2 [Daphnia sinensis]|uniref:Arthropsin2 n=1 Tax=Daphnia sinensis TaxID=1820382 RepID=A0AAD5KI78_9CRUS|nr:arthropsin2 [Daphnia sinensis]